MKERITKEVKERVMMQGKIMKLNKVLIDKSKELDKKAKSEGHKKEVCHQCKGCYLRRADSILDTHIHGIQYTQH